MPCFSHRRYDKTFAKDWNEAIPRVELDNTWNGGRDAVQRAIDSGAYTLLAGPGGVEYVQKRILRWGRDAGRETSGEIKKASRVRTI